MTFLRRILPVSCLVLLIVGCSSFESAKAPFEHELAHLTAPTSPSETIETARGYVQGGKDIGESDSLLRGFMAASLFEKNSIKKASTQIQLPSSLEDPVRYESAGVAMELVMEGEQSYVSEVQDGVLYYQAEWGDETISYHYDRDAAVHKEWIVLNAPRSSFVRRWELIDADQYTVTPTEQGGFAIQPLEYAEEFAFELLPAFYLDAKGVRHEEGVLLTYQDGVFTLEISDLEEVEFPIAIDPSLVLPVGPPTVYSIDAAVDQVITVEFDSAATLMDATTFLVYDKAGRVPGLYANPSGSTYTFTPTRDYVQGRRVEVILTTGTGLTTPYIWEFTIGTEPGTFAYPAHTYDNPTPAAPTYSSGGTLPRSIDVGDFDADGDLDVVTVNDGSDNISLLLGNGDGTLGTASTFAGSGFANQLVVGDFDGDGDPDVVTNGNGDLDYYQNTGGTFAAVSATVTTGSPGFLDAADMDGDGDLDLVFDQGVVIHIYDNDGSGNFSSAGTYNPGTTTVGLKLADADLDGDIDIFLLSGLSGTVEVVDNQGTGTSFIQSDVDFVVSNPNELYVNDFNGDGYVDVAIASYSLTRVYVLTNQGNGNLGSTASYQSFQKPTEMDGGDIDGDGDIDLMVNDADASAWIALENAGDGTFTGGVFPDVWSYNTSGTPVDVTGGDFNNDGRFDVVTSSFITNNLTMFLNTAPAVEDISGTCFQSDGSTPCVDGLTVRVAVDGVLAPETTTTSSGTWTISNVTMQYDSVLTVFLDGVAEADEANVVTQYDGTGAVGGVGLVGQRLSIGSNDGETISTSEIALYDNSASGDEDIFFDFSGATLTTDDEGGHTDHAFFIANGSTYENGSFSEGITVVTNDVIIGGTFDLNIGSLQVNGSWDNNGTFNGTSGSIVFITSGSETIDSTTASTFAFGDVIFTSSGTYTLLSPFTADSITLQTSPTVTTATTITMANNGSIACTSPTSCGTINQTSGVTTMSGTANLNAGLTGDFTFGTLSLIGSGTTTATGQISTVNDLNIGNGSSARTFDVNTNDARISVGQDFTVNTNAVVQASDTSPFVIGRDFTNGGSFNTNGGTVQFNTTQTSTVNGSNTWDNLSVTTPGKTILFESTQIQTVNGSLVLVGAAGNELTVDATVDTSQWLIDHQGAEVVDYINYEDSGCDPGSTTITVARSTDNGNNGSCFEVAAEVLSVSPSENALDVAVNSDITITFDQTMNGATATQGNLPVYGSISGLIAGAYSLETSSVSNDTIRFNPTSDFIPGEIITVSVTPGILSNVGSSSMRYDSRFYAAVSLGSGIFANRQDYTRSGNFSQLMSQGDFTNDGYLDIVIGSNGGLQVFTNDGDGTFTAGVNLGGTQADRQMDVADVDKDGNMDILAPNSLNVSVHLGNGDGTFQAVTNYSQLYEVKAVKAADINGDGDFDLVASTFNSGIPGRGAVAVLLGDGAGNFQPEIETMTPLQGHYGAAVNDFNNDGKLDVVTGAYWDGVSYLLLGVGDGTFQDPVSFTTSSNPVFHGSAEWSGDGNADFAVSTTNLQLYFGDGAGGLTLNNIYGSVGLGQYATGDIDADGDLDLVTVDYSNAFGRVRFNDGSGGFSSSTNYTTANTGSGAVTLGDYNNDGALDFVVTASQDTNFTVYHNTIQTDLSGSCLQNDGVTNCADGLTVRYALNGVLQAETTTTSGGAWTISSGASFSADDDIHVFLDGVAENQEAVAVTTYDGTGDMTGFQLIGERLMIGSDDNPTVDGAALGVYDNTASGDEDIFFEIGASNALTVDSEGGHDETLQILSGSTYATADINTHDLIIDGTLDASSGFPNIFVYGSWDNNSEFIEGTSRVLFYSTSTGETIGVTGATDGDFYNVEFNGSGAEWSPDGTVIINDLYMYNGTFEIGAQNVELNGGNIYCAGICGTINQSNGQSFTIKNNGIIGSSGSGFGTFRFGGINIDSGGYTLQIDEDISAQSINPGGNGNILDLNTYDPTVTLDAISASSSSTIEASDTSPLIIGSFQGLNGTFNNNGGTVQIQGSFSDISGAVTFAKLEKTSISEFNILDNLTVTDSLTITEGVFNLNGRSLTLTGATFSNNAVLRLRGTETLIGFTQDTDSGVFEYVGDNGGGPLSIKDFGSTDYYDLIINDTNVSPSNFQTAGNMVIANDLDVLAGTFQQTFDVTVNGTSTFTLDGGTYTQGVNDLIVAGDMDIISGTFTGSSNSNVIDVGGSFSQSGGTFTSTNGNLEVAGDFTVNSGTFANNSGAVVLDGTSQNVSGDIVFNTFTKSVASADTLTFADNNTYQFDGLLTLSGLQSELLTIQSNPDGDGNRWTMNAQAGTFVFDTSIKDSACDVSSNNIIANRSVDAGNNDDCWLFDLQFDSITPAQHSVGAALNSNIEVVFDKEVNLGTVTSSTMPVYGHYQGLIAGAYSLSTTSVANDTVVFNPTSDFEEGEKVEVILTDSIAAADSASFRPSRVIQFTMSAGTSNSSYQIQAGFSTGMTTVNEPYTTYLGYFDGDANLDMMLANGGPDASEAVQSYLGDGDGTFTLTDTYAVTFNSRANEMTGGDFDGDGDMDIAVTFGNLNIVRIFLSDGDGTFTSADYSLGQATPVGLYVSDFNADGSLDIASASILGDTVAILLGIGDGTFNAGVTYATTVERPFELDGGDFNRDGIIDIVVYAQTTQDVGILEGNGDGTFQPGVQAAALGTTATYEMEVADFTGDANLDVITRAGSTAQYLVGDGTLSLTFDSNLGTSTSTFLAIDYDADDDLDLARGISATSIDMHVNDGTGDLSSSSTVASVPVSRNLVSGDLNNDGTLDLVAVSEGTEQVYVMLNLPTISISGTCLQNDESTNCANGLTVTAAVNGVATGMSTTTSGGSWTLGSVYAESGDVVTVYLDGAAEAQEAITVAKYDGTGDMTGLSLIGERLIIGSPDNQEITNADLALFDNGVAGDEDIFFEIDGNNDLVVDSEGGHNEELVILSGNTFRPDSGSSGNVSTNDIQIDGTLTADNNTLTIAGSWVDQGGFGPGNSTVVFSSSTTGETIDTAAALDFHDVQMTGSGGEWTFVNDINLNDLTISAGTMLSDQNVVINNLLCNTTCGSIDMSTIGARLTVSGTGNIAQGTGGTLTIDYLSIQGAGTSSLAHDVNLRAFEVHGGATFDLDTFDPQMITSGLNSDVIIFANGVFQASDTTLLQIGSSLVVNAADGVFVANGGVVEFTGAGGGVLLQTAADNISLATLTYSGSGTFQLGNGSDDTITVTTALNITDPSGTVDMDGSDLVMTGATFSNDGTFQLYGSEAITGLTNNDTDSGLWRYTGDSIGGATSFILDSFTSNDFYALEATGESDEPFTVPGPFVVVNDFTLNEGVLDQSGEQMDVNGTSTLTINGGEFDQSGPLNVAGDLVMTDGVFTGGSDVIDIDGSFDLQGGTFTSTSGTMNVAGDYSVTSGTFSNNSGAVVLDGTTQNVTGDITFNDFAKSVSSADTLTVADDSTLQVDGALNLTGASGQLLTIRSNPDAGSTQWFINSQGTSTAQFLDLKDAGCDVGSNNIEVSDSTDSGNNDSCWQFPISVSGTCLQRDNTTNCANGQTVAIAVNGVLDAATTTTSAGAWTLSNVPVFSAGDVITVFLDAVGESNEAIAVAKYDGSGDMSGVELIEENLTIGSDDNQTITNADIALYDNSVSGDEDIFMDVAASNDLSVDITTHDDVLRVLSGNTLRLDDGNSGNLTANDVVIEGILRADANSIIVGGSWDNDSEFIADTSTVTFTSTTTETIDSTGATDSDFNDLILFGSGGQWTLSSALTAADISVEVGTLLGAQDVTVTGGSFSCPTTCGTVNLMGGTTTLIGAGDLGDESLSGNGSFSLVNLTLEGTGTTVLGSALSLNGTLTIGDGTNAHVFDLNTRDQEVTANGDVVIAANSTLSASNSANFNARRDWTNNGTFTHNSGTVVFDPGPLAVTISGANTWFNFTSTTAGKTLQFENGVTQTVEGLLTLTGSDGSLISVDSDSGGNQWLIDHQGTESVEYVNFQDTGCDALSTDITLTATSVDNGNNGSCLLFDTDGDGIVDVSDNCPNDANAGQENNDGDALGDVCDPDDDNDGILDGSDSAPFDEFECADSDSDTCDDCSVAGTSQPANDGTDTDTDGLCDAGDPDDDGDGVADGSDGDPLDAFVCSDTDSDTCDDCSVSGSQTPSNDGPDNDTDGLCDAGDPDDDNDGFADGADCQPNNASVNPGAAEVCNDAIDNDCDGDTDLADSDCATFDTDGDGVPDVSDPAPSDNSVCGDSDSDTCDDCGVANTFAPANDGPDNESDGLCDAGDPDDDNDSVLDGADADPFDEFVCEDSDSDTCDDCAVAGNAQPNNDGADNESDGLCDAGDPDDDNDGILDGSDADPFDEFVCADSDSDTCDDCSVTGTSTPANDGTDTDTDGLCDAGDSDDDGDGFNDGADCQPLVAAVNPGASEVCNDAIDNDCDGDTDLADADCAAFDGDSDGVPDINDADPNDNFVCADSDSDSCDDCSVAGTSQPANDGTDTDTDGLCDAGDPDDDGDGVADGSDADPLDASVCSDTDSDSCDDCSVTNTQTPNNDGTDTDTDGLCNAGDPDDDGDGILDGADADPLDASVCSDTDSDSCDDCSVTNTQTPNNDGLDTDTDGLCDAGDPDDDGDGEPDGSDCQPLNPAVNPSATEVCNDAVDNDCDGDTDLADADCATFDSDGDGIPDVTDTNPSDEFICADNDADTCDDCSVSGFSDPGNDGTDTDSDGACDAGDGDDDNDGVPDGSDTAPLDNAVCSDTDSDTCDDCSVTNSQTPNNDGLDTDTDGLCDAGDNDDDGDGFNDGGDCQPLNASINPGAVEICNDSLDNDCDGDVDLADSDCTGFDGDSDGIPDLSDPNPADPNVCGDADGDSCDDCSVAGASQPANDGLDTDADGICNVGDNDDDGDGVNDGVDSNPIDPSQCSDLDSDGCNDCSVTNTQTPNNDGPDDDADGICNAGEGGGGLSRGRFDSASDRTNVFDQEDEEAASDSDDEQVAVDDSSADDQESPLKGSAPIEEATPVAAGDDSQQEEAQQQIPSGGSNVTRYYPYVLVEEEDEDDVEPVKEEPVEPTVGLFVGIDFSMLMPPEEPEMESEPIFAPVASDPDVRELQKKVHVLKRLFQWMDPEGYELTGMNGALRDTYLRKQLVREQILSIGESVDDSVNEYLPLVRDPLDAPVSNIAELMKTLFISVDGICYTSEQLQRAFAHDTPDNGWWYAGYWYFMWELMIDYFGSQHLPWQDVGSIFFYGIFEDYVNDYCGRTDI